MSQCYYVATFSLLLLLPYGGGAQSGDPAPPSVIVILADDLGYNDLSCYRNTHPAQGDQPPTSQTPHLDTLAAQGMLFTDFYAGAAVCSPSRAALLTGRNATRVGVYNWIPENSPMHLRSEEVTLAEVLRKSGYTTAHFGKWHLTAQGTSQPLPNDQGFDYSFYAYNNAIPSHRNPENYFRNGKAVGKLEGYACQLVADEAIDWLKQKKTDAPFYLNVWFNEPHLKVAAPEEFTKRHQYNQDYYGAIENMNRAVGRLLAFLQEKGLEEETIIVFTSDNGSRWGHSNDPLRGEKCFNYEGGVRVPFVVRWPGRVPAGKVSDVPGSFTDLLPTIADLAQASLPTNRTLDGVSLAPVLTEGADTLERSTPLFFYRYFHDPICMLREGNWSLLGYRNPIPYAETLNESELANIRPWQFEENHMEYLDTLQPVHFELYDLSTDEAQKHNVAQQYPERVTTMKQQMLQLRDEMVREGGNWFE